MPACDYPLEIVRKRQWLATGVLALFFRDSNSLTLTLKNILTLELRDGRKYGEHEFTGWCSGVDGLLAADKLNLLFSQPCYKVEQVACVAGKAADRLDNNRIAVPDVFHHAVQLWTVSVFAAGLVDKQFINAEVVRQDFLTCSILVPGADADIADFHGVSLL